MPNYQCPACKKPFGEGASKAVYCGTCKKIVKPQVAPEPEPVVLAPIGGALGAGPQPPAVVMPNAPAGAAAVPPPLLMPGRVGDHPPLVETVQTKIQRVADAKRTTAVYFTWCPAKYAQDWITAAAEGNILKQGRVKPERPPQGGGLYCVGSPARSSCWAKEGTVCLAVRMVNVPTICLHDKGQMLELCSGAPVVNEDTLYNNGNVDALCLLTYGGNDGGFSRLTASAGVTITMDLIALLGEAGCAAERSKLATAAKPAWDAQMETLRKKGP